MKFKDLKVGEFFIVKDEFGHTAICKKLNNSRTTRYENTRVVKGKYENRSTGVWYSWTTPPSTDIKKLK